MQLFCEECGSKLSPGVLFCENCGTKIEQSKDVLDDLMDDMGITESVTESVPLEHGILFTDLNKVVDALGRTPEMIDLYIKQKMGAYLEQCKKTGIFYHHCPCPESLDLHEHIEAVKKYKEKYNAKYLLILGGYSVVPPVYWDNPAGDSDEKVASDLCYAVLDETPPQKGVAYDFDNALCVGRIPEEAFTWETFGQYLEYRSLLPGKFPSRQEYPADEKDSYDAAKGVIKYGISALQWENPSTGILSGTSKNSRLNLSPLVNLDVIEQTLHPHTTLLYANLHGSNETKYWYGQDGGSYPQAVSPESLNTLEEYHFIAVEACYGAYFDGKTPESSILLKALSKKCVAFFGSSTIAYGAVGTDNKSCADVIVDEYLKKLDSGKTCGQSVNEARKALCSKELNDTELKTLMQFNLYGDPAAWYNPYMNKKTAVEEDEKAAPKSFRSSILVAVPDVRNAVRTSLAVVNDKINAAVNEKVYRKFSEMKDVVPVSFEVKKGFSSSYKNTYTKSFGPITQNVVVYFEKDGTITKELVSK